MTANGEINVRLFRYDPTSGEPPRYDAFRVPRRPLMRVLDVLTHIYDTTEDSSLAHRWYCGTKKCGECALTVNGTPMLGCWEPAADDMTLAPLANFPILRDLAVDTAPYERMLVGELKTTFHRAKHPHFPERISQTAMRAANHLIKCIECNVCTAAVPAKVGAAGIDWSGAAGPAAFVRFARFALDPRDDLDRKPLAAKAGLDGYPLYPALRKICPQGIDVVADALVPAQEALFGRIGAAPAEVKTSTPLIVAPSWSAFVRLTDESKRALQAAGRLQARAYPGIDEAYAVVER